MARRKKKRPQGFLTGLFMLFLLVAVFYFVVLRESGPKTEYLYSEDRRVSDSPSSLSIPETQAGRAVEAPTVFPRPASELRVDTVAVSKVFSADMLDDYVSIPLLLDKNTEGILILGARAPKGKDPKQILNPEQAGATPFVLLAKREDKKYSVIDTFDFQTSGPTFSGLLAGQLIGIPRIKDAEIQDLDADGSPEWIFKIDTKEDWAVGVACLSLENGKFHWATVKDQNGSEKLALFKSGAGEKEAFQFELKKHPETEKWSVITRMGTLNPKHPELGFLWRTSVFDFKKGVLLEKSE